MIFGSAFLMTDIIMFCMFITLKFLTPFFLITKGPEAAKTIMDLDFSDMSIIKMVWDSVTQ